MKHLLGHTAVKLQCLDKNKDYVASATGFFLRRSGNLYLYTCWHVVTGIESWQPLQFSRAVEQKKRRFLTVCSQNVTKLVTNTGQPAGESIGGKREFHLPLYDAYESPTWHQDKRDVPHEDLNAIKIRVPFWHDAVAFPLSPDQPISPLQVIDEEHFFRHTKSLGAGRFQGRSYSPGDRVFIVGYPYGFSTAGDLQPEAIVLVRHVASMRLRYAGLHGRQVLLDGPGAPGMSGSPVFVETDRGLELIGAYTHVIYPDNPGGKAEKTTALGVVTELTQSWGAIPLVPQSEIGEPE